MPIISSHFWKAIGLHGNTWKRAVMSLGEEAEKASCLIWQILHIKEWKPHQYVVLVLKNRNISWLLVIIWWCHEGPTPCVSQQADKCQETRVTTTEVRRRDAEQQEAEITSSVSTCHSNCNVVGSLFHLALPC